jgi:hypothetical protein
MKLLAVVLLMAVSVQAQSLAEAARKERERQAKLRPSQVITSTQPRATEQAGPEAAKSGPAQSQPAEPAKEPPKPAAKPAVDPVQVWNEQLNQLRVRVRALQDQELALLLQENQTTNQVYAPVTDPATHERAQAQLGQVRESLISVRRDLEEAKTKLDALQLAGPPKK